MNPDIIGLFSDPGIGGRADCNMVRRHALVFKQLLHGNSNWSTPAPDTDDVIWFDPNHKSDVPVGRSSSSNSLCRYIAFRPCPPLNCSIFLSVSNKWHPRNQLTIGLQARAPEKGRNVRRLKCLHPERKSLPTAPLMRPRSPDMALRNTVRHEVPAEWKKRRDSKRCGFKCCT